MIDCAEELVEVFKESCANELMNKMHKKITLHELFHFKDF